jgi:hypothetical protein
VTNISTQPTQQEELDSSTKNGMGSPNQCSSIEDIDRSLDKLSSGKSRWINLDLRQKIQFLDQIMVDFNSIAQEWVTLSMKAKGIPKNSFGEGEEWFNIAISNRLIRLYKESLVDILNHGKPHIPGPITKLENGQVSVQVFPQKPIDRLLLRGTTCQVLMESGIKTHQVKDNQAVLYRKENPAGAISLVLGAGNTSFLLPGDILAKLFGEGHVVIFKPNPINEYLGHLVEHAFRSVIQPGFMQVVYGGAEQGSYLCQHPSVDDLHMTGSHHTFEAIVFGPGEEGALRKANKNPILNKRFTAELGNITPVIVIPGEWSEDDIKTQGAKIATWLVYNAGFACPAPRLVIQQESWPHREALNQAIAESLAQVEPRSAFYPGAGEIHNRFIAAHPSAQQFGEPKTGQLPWTFITDIDSSDVNNISFKEEPFCSILAETSIEADSCQEFIQRAVSFVNEHVWGTLHVILIVHPKSQNDVHIASEIEKGISVLNYGTVSVNQYPAISYYIGFTGWGGYPGQDIYDIQSGNGFVNNTLMLADIQKNIMRAPFNLSPDPFVISTKRAHEFGEKMANYEAFPSLRQLPGIIWTVFRSPHEHILQKGD